MDVFKSVFLYACLHVVVRYVITHVRMDGCMYVCIYAYFWMNRYVITYVGLCILIHIHIHAFYI